MPAAKHFAIEWTSEKTPHTPQGAKSKNGSNAV
jgi:hypothetical protein